VKAARRTLLAAQAAPDGCTLAMGHVATHGVNMAVHRNPGCETARDVVTLGITFTAANILVVNPQRQAAIRTAQASVGVCRAKPRDLSDGSAGVGSPARPNCGPSPKAAGPTSPSRSGT
jgi:tripartite-type tricarboxylate transporter receptor subunit TctC